MVTALRRHTPLAMLWVLLGCADAATETSLKPEFHWFADAGWSEPVHLDAPINSSARELGAAVELRYVSAPADTLYQRIRERDRENPPITQEDVAKWVALFQEPTPEEMALFDG